MKEWTSAPQPEKLPLVIRAAEPDDLPACSHLDAGYHTDYVWQMQFQEGERAVQSAFQRVRLPRTMAVAYPYPPDAVLAMLEATPRVFVACYGDLLIGCGAGQAERWSHAFTLHTLIVHPRARRRGVGRLLLDALKEAAVQDGCRRLNVTVQSKNYPAIQFARKEGFAFCGYNDRFYPNGDIALFFSLGL